MDQFAGSSWFFTRVSLQLPKHRMVRADSDSVLRSQSGRQHPACPIRYKIYRNWSMHSMVFIIHWSHLVCIRAVDSILVPFCRPATSTSKKTAMVEAQIPPWSMSQSATMAFLSAFLPLLARPHHTSQQTFFLKVHMLRYAPKWTGPLPSLRQTALTKEMMAALHSTGPGEHVWGTYILELNICYSLVSSHILILVATL